MNFLFLTFDFPPAVGGIQTRAANYVKNLVKMGHKVTVVHLLDPEVLKTFFGEKPTSKQLHENFHEAQVFRYPSSVKNIFKVFFQTVKMLKRNGGVDIVHIISGANTPLGILFLLYGKLKRLKTGISLYGKDILASFHLYSIFQRIGMLLADRIAVNSKATLKLIPKTFHRKTRILYPGVDPTYSSIKTQTKRTKQKTILYVGRLVKRKGADDLIKVHKQILQKIPNTKLVIVGDGPYRKNLETLTKKLGIQDKVEFTGTLKGRKLYEKYAECNVFAMPSKRLVHDVEGFGMVFLEAALLKKPVVGTRSGGIPEAVIHGKTGLLIEPGDTQALKEALLLLLTDEKLARKLGENAYKRATQKFTWEKATQKFLEMYTIF